MHPSPDVAAQLPAQHVLLLGVAGVGTRGHKHLGSSLETVAGVWEGRTVCGESSFALLYSTRTEAEVMGSNYTGKHRSDPRGDSTWENAHIVIRSPSGSWRTFCSVCFKKYIFWRVQVRAGKQAKCFLQPFPLKALRMTSEPRPHARWRKGGGQRGTPWW